MKVVIIGGVAAGSKAAAKIRNLSKEIEINLYTQDTHVSYSECGLPYYIEGYFDDYKMLLVRSPEEFEQQNIHIHLKHKVTKILPKFNKILVEDNEKNKAFLVDYDKLIIATGARPFIPNIKNINLKNVFTLRSIEDGIKIKEKLLNSKKAVIIGSGYIGMELLEAFVKQNVHTTVLEKANYIMTNFDEDISSLIKEQITSVSDGRFDIYTGKNVMEFSGDCDGIRSVITESGENIEGDMVVIASGVIPNVDIATDAGINLGITGAIKVDCDMKTNIDNIYACGDCVEKNLMITNTPVWIPLGSNAYKEGRCAALNVYGDKDCFEGILGSVVTRCFSFTMSMTGLTEKQAKILDFDTISTTVTDSDIVGYMPNVNNITLKLVADKKSGKLLGGQAVGAGNADKRINSLTSALTAKMTVKELASNDLTYAPPYSTTIDPLLNAAQILAEKLNN